LTRQYFNDIIVMAARAMEKEGSEMTEIKEAHELMLDIHAAAPAALLNVLPQLEEELKVFLLIINRENKILNRQFEDEDLRQLAMETLGKLFCQNTSKIPQQFPQTWQAWLDRRNDKSAEIRVLWIACCPLIIQSHPSLIREVCGIYKYHLLQLNLICRRAGAEIP
jgi:sister-chromatid-cohesion protein PDS5